MVRERRRAPLRPKADTGRWWRRHPAAAVSGGIAAVLLILGAIVNPLATRAIDMIWPAVQQGTSPTTGSSSAGGLVAIGRWPPENKLICQSGVHVAGLTGTPSPLDLVPTANEDLRITAIRQLGAIVWYQGKLAITLTSADDTPLLIMAMEPVVFAKRDTAPSWGMEVSPGCGGPAQIRVLRTLLDRGTLEDMGVRPGGPDNPRAKAAPLGPSFTVSASDPADITVLAYACSGLYDFGMKITYISRGATYTELVGSPEHPFRIVGGWHGVERFYSDLGISVSEGPLPNHGGPQIPTGVPLSARDICGGR